MKTLYHMRTKAKSTTSSCLSWILFNLSVTALYFIVSSTIVYAGQITLGWDKSTESDVIGCKIYYGTATGNYTQSIKIASPNITTCTILNLSDGQRYYFAATAYNAELIESDYSAEVFATISPITTTVQPTTTTTSLITTTTTSMPRSTTSTTITSCSYSISPTFKSFKASSGIGTVKVSTRNECGWTAAVNNNTGWIKIISGSSGTGSGTVSYSVAANTSKAPRIGNITVGGRTFTVMQKR